MLEEGRGGREGETRVTPFNDGNGNVKRWL